MRLNVRAKLLGTSSVLIALMVGLGIFSVMNVNSLGTSVEDLNTRTVQPLEELGLAYGLFNEIRATANRHMLSQDPAEKTTLEASMSATRAVFDEAMAAVEPALVSDAQKQLYASIVGGSNTYHDALVPILDLSRQGRSAEAFAAAKDVAVPAAGKVATDLKALLADESKVADAAEQAVTASVGFATMLTIGIIILAAGLGFALSLVLARTIARGVKDVQQTVTSLAEKDATWLAEGMGRLQDNDLTYAITPATPPIERYGTDEIGRTAESTNALRDKDRGRGGGLQRGPRGPHGHGHRGPGGGRRRHPHQRAAQRGGHPDRGRHPAGRHHDRPGRGRHRRAGPGRVRHQRRGRGARRGHRHGRPGGGRHLGAAVGRSLDAVGHDADAP